MLTSEAVKEIKRLAKEKQLVPFRYVVDGLTHYGVETAVGIAACCTTDNINWRYQFIDSSDDFHSSLRQGKQLDFLK